MFPLYPTGKRPDCQALYLSRKRSLIRFMILWQRGLLPLPLLLFSKKYFHFLQNYTRNSFPFVYNIVIMILARKLKLNPTPEQKLVLMDTLLHYKKCVQHCLSVGFQNKLTSGSKLHSETYFPLRAQSNLPSQLVCSARTKAIESLKAIKSKIRIFHWSK